MRDGDEGVGRESKRVRGMEKEEKEGKQRDLRA